MLGVRSAGRLRCLRRPLRIRVLHEVLPHGPHLRVLPRRQPLSPPQYHSVSRLAYELLSLSALSGSQEARQPGKRRRDLFRLPSPASRGRLEAKKQGQRGSIASTRANDHRPGAERTFKRAGIWRGSEASGPHTMSTTWSVAAS